MSMILKLPSDVAQRVGSESVELQCTTVREAVLALVKMHPKARDLLFNSQDHLRNTLIGQVNGQLVSVDEEIPGGSTVWIGFLRVSG